MKDLVIVGAGGCGREVLQWAKDINAVTPKWDIKGFIDDHLDVLDSQDCGVSVIGSIDGYEISPNDVFVCSIGNSAVRKKLVAKLENRGATFTTLVHPTAVVSLTAKLGKGVILYPFSLISDHAVIGDGTIINMYSSVAHDSMLGEFCTISAHCDITGACRLGSYVFMGTTSNMVPGTIIGDDVYICAGSTVMAPVRKGRKVLGNPAKIVKL